MYHFTLYAVVSDLTFVRIKRGMSDPLSRTFNYTVSPWPQFSGEEAFQNSLGLREIESHVSINTAQYNTTVIDIALFGSREMAQSKFECRT